VVGRAEKELEKRYSPARDKRDAAARQAEVEYGHEGELNWVGEPARSYAEPARHVYAGARPPFVTTQLLPVVVGTGVVLKSAGPGRVRLLMSDKGESLAGSFERSPSTNFVRAFVKKYRRANPPGTRAR
jgi:hypothetical protein